MTLKNILFFSLILLIGCAGIPERYVTVIHEKKSGMTLVKYLELHNIPIVYQSNNTVRINNTQKTRDTLIRYLYLTCFQLDVINNNIANVNTTRTIDGKPYCRKFVDFDKKGNAVILQDSSTPYRKIYDPSHPDSDEDGYVSLSNVNIVTEMIDMINTSQQRDITAEILHRFDPSIVIYNSDRFSDSPVINIDYSEYLDTTAVKLPDTINDSTKEKIKDK